MNRAWIGAAVALLLAGCGQLEHDELYLIEVRTVELPASVAADAPLNVTVEVGFGGCSKFDHFEATRSATQLKVQAFGLQRVGKNVTCPAIYGSARYTYTDPGIPARTDPFEVIVNGKSWGKVTVK